MSQEPMMGIMKTSDHDDFAHYRVACNCSDADHDLNISIELDEDFHEVTVHVYSEVKTAYWNRNFDYSHGTWYYSIADFANDAINRVKLAYQALVKGYVVMESYTLLNKDVALNLADALRSGVEKIEENAKL